LVFLTGGHFRELKIDVSKETWDETDVLVFNRCGGYEHFLQYGMSGPSQRLGLSAFTRSPGCYRCKLLSNSEGCDRGGGVVRIPPGTFEINRKNS
jgi:hypothetical protein